MPSTLLNELIDARRIVQACASGAIYPVFQPIVDLNTRHISSFEVLARWRDDELGIIPPTTFIPLIEAHALIGLMTEHLMMRACSAAMHWRGDFRLAFNISPLHFRDPSILPNIEAGPRLAGFPLSRVQIEITEHAVIDDLGRARSAIEYLKQHGVRIILDDFGTGYSSLTRLQALPFDKIKIDKSFVQTMSQLQESRKIASAVVGLANSLGLPTVAEGVETEDQAEMLIELGCLYGQGWLFGWPVMADKVPALIERLGVKGHDPDIVNFPISERLAHLKSIYASLPIGLCYLDHSLHLVSANPIYGEIFRIDVSSALGRSILDILPGVDGFTLPDLQAALRREKPIGRRVIRLGDQRHALLTMDAVRDAGGEMLGLSVAVLETMLLADDESGSRGAQESPACSTRSTPSAWSTHSSM